MLDPTRRFSSRVDNYVRYRPNYPDAVRDTLVARCGVTPASVIADVGSGTGILTAVLLATGATVFAIEPNGDMRRAAERALAGTPGFRSIDGRAEATTLDDASVDVITAGQSFHWFDRDAARTEFRRVLRPGGWVALVWNDRELASTPFLAEYEQLLRRYGTDYDRVQSSYATRRTVDAFFAHPCELMRFPNRQLFDRDGLRGRVLSSSYAPEPGHTAYEPMMRELDALFDTYAVDGKVAFEYVTSLYLGRL